jgi:hypothetical protein
MPTINQQYSIRVYIPNIKYVIPRENLLTVTFKEAISDLIPRVVITLNDKGHMTEHVPLIDGDTIEITFAATSESEPITMSFIVSEFIIAPKQEGTTSTITITGLLNCNGLYEFKSRMLEGSSKDVLGTVAKEFGLTFKSDADAYDTMKWFQYGNNLSFVNHVMNRSYIPDDSALFFVGCNGTARFSSLSNAWKADKKFTALYDIASTQRAQLVSSEKDIMYFMSFDIISTNGKIKRDVGYGEYYISYDGNGEAKKESYNNKNRDANITNVSNDYDGKFSKYKRFGWVGSNPTVFKEYHKAVVQNETILVNLFENTLSMKINPSTQVNLLDKVSVKIPSFSDSGHNMNDVWSGDYLVVGIAHSMSFGGPYEKRVLLARRGMNKSKERKVYNVK